MQGQFIMASQAGSVGPAMAMGIGAADPQRLTNAKKCDADDHHHSAVCGFNLVVAELRVQQVHRQQAEMDPADYSEASIV